MSEYNSKYKYAQITYLLQLYLKIEYFLWKRTLENNLDYNPFMNVDQ